MFCVFLLCPLVYIPLTDISLVEEFQRWWVLKIKIFGQESTYSLCLVLLCDQNSFGRSKMVLVWPNWFGLDHNDLVLTKMKWSRPKWIGQVQIMIFYQNESYLDLTRVSQRVFWLTLDLTNSFWSGPFHFGQVQINLVRPNHFGRTKTVLVT